tara:strand:- start:1588 stop:1977 length:390 start_codon:yes stop_codon:yes gene_type:complete
MGFYNLSDFVKNPAFITPWTFIHLVSGIFTYMLLEKFITKDVWINFYIFLVVHIGYEIKDLSYYMDYNKIVKNSYWSNNSLPNSIGDVLFSTIGFLWAVSFKSFTNGQIFLCGSFLLLGFIIFNYNKYG